MMDRVAAGIVEWLREQGWERDQYRLTLVDHPGSPWLLVDADRVMPVVPFVVGEIEAYSFAAWKTTGAVHLSIKGEVQDPELFRVEP